MHKKEASELFNVLGKIRFVQVNTPERGEPGYHEAKDYVKEKCLGKTVYLDIDDKKHYDKYNRTLAIVYTENLDINRELLNELLSFIITPCGCVRK